MTRWVARRVRFRKPRKHWIALAQYYPICQAWSPKRAGLICDRAEDAAIDRLCKHGRGQHSALSQAYQGYGGPDR